MPVILSGARRSRAQSKDPYPAYTVSTAPALGGIVKRHLFLLILISSTAFAQSKPQPHRRRSLTSAAAPYTTASPTLRRRTSPSGSPAKRSIKSALTCSLKAAPRSSISAARSACPVSSTRTPTCCCKATSPARTTTSRSWNTPRPIAPSWEPLRRRRRWATASLPFAILKPKARAMRTLTSRKPSTTALFPGRA